MNKYWWETHYLAFFNWQNLQPIQENTASDAHLLVQKFPFFLTPNLIMGFLPISASLLPMNVLSPIHFIRSLNKS